MMLYLLTWIFVIGLASCEKPNIIFVLVDDVGWADFNYSTGGVGSIPTPNIDSLSSKGARKSMLSLSKNDWSLDWLMKGYAWV